MPNLLKIHLPWEILRTISRSGSFSDTEKNLCKTVFLNADSATRKLWVETFYLSEDMVVFLLQDTNRVEFNRVGKVLLHYRTPPDTKQGPFGRRSERVLRAALDRAAKGVGNKPFVIQLCYELSKTPLGQTLAEENPELLNKVVSRALGGGTFVEGIHTVGTAPYMDVVAKLYKTLHRLNADEVDRLVAVCPTSAALEATDWAGNISRHGQDKTAAGLLGTLSKYVGRKNPHNIGVVLSSNLDLFVAASDQYVSPLCRQKDGTYEEGVVPPVFYHGDTVLDAPLALFRHGVTPARLSWVFNLWTGTHTGPSVEGCVGAMFTQPDLLLLLLTGPPDGSGDAQLVAAAEFAIAAQAVPAVLTDRSPYWMTGVVKRILSNTPVRSQLLRNFLMGVDPTVKAQFLAGKFPANRA